MHNDRRAVELLFWPFLIQSFALSQEPCQRDDDERAELKNIIDGCKSAVGEVMTPLDGKRARKLADRTTRIAGHVANVHLEGKAGGHVGMALYYALESLLSADRLSLTDGSPFATSLTKLVASLAEFFEITKQDAAAQKTARRMLATLRDEGYFR